MSVIVPWACAHSLALESTDHFAHFSSDHSDENGLSDQINIDLTYSVCFNLANQYHVCGMYTEALSTYTIIVKNKQYAQSGRLRVNMGNIYYEQARSAHTRSYHTALCCSRCKDALWNITLCLFAVQKKYSAAIKMYRMALDQIPNTGREVRYKIMRNIGNAFVRLGQFQDAIASFEQVIASKCIRIGRRLNLALLKMQIMEGSPDPQTGFNLVLCYYAAGEKERMKKGFSRLLSVRQFGMDDDALEAHIDDVLQARSTFQ